ncbi:hypothetical protein COCNU_08G011070 [Cocos nucifera]|uniref:Uncharacterized protein n=1 Tax=Cocos nucifera TaxID=13894 RepID=A0A8K0IK49_COCNU|nr:hypothetical protein COCNU_08G011070 [Cocos nucifera]
MVEEDLSDGTLNESDGWSADPVSGTELIGKKQMAIEGFKAQSELVIESLDRLITAWEEWKESVVVEGVHLSFNLWWLKAELLVSGSEEEADDPPDGDSDEDLTENKEFHGSAVLLACIIPFHCFSMDGSAKMEGSVDENSTKTDEYYVDLAMRDGPENGYWSENDDGPNNVDKIIWISSWKISEHVAEPPCHIPTPSSLREGFPTPYLAQTGNVAFCCEDGHPSVRCTAWKERKILGIFYRQRGDV